MFCSGLITCLDCTSDLNVTYVFEFEWNQQSLQNDNQYQDRFQVIWSFLECWILLCGCEGEM